MEVKVICLEERAFQELIHIVIKQAKEELSAPAKRWVTPAEAMKMLNIKSKATLQKFRDDGRIRFCHPERRIILYDCNSIQEFFEDNVGKSFNKKR